MIVTYSDTQSLYPAKITRRNIEVRTGRKNVMLIQ